MPCHRTVSWSWITMIPPQFYRCCPVPKSFNKMLKVTEQIRCSITGGTSCCEFRAQISFLCIRLPLQATRDTLINVVWWVYRSREPIPSKDSSNAQSVRRDSVHLYGLRLRPRCKLQQRGHNQETHSHSQCWLLQVWLPGSYSGAATISAGVHSNDSDKDNNAHNPPETKSKRPER